MSADHGPTGTTDQQTRSLTNARIWLPFVLVGVVAAAADWVRRTDPIPILVRTQAPTTFQIRVSPMPTARRLVGVDLGALVGLRPLWLVELVAIHAVVLAFGAVATAAVISGYLDRPELRRSDAVTRLVAYYLAVLVTLGVLGLVLSVVPLVGLLVVVLGFWVFARLALAPVVALDGASVRGAARRSYALTRGKAFPLALFLLVLAAVEMVVLEEFTSVGGTFVATAVVGTLHATGIAHYYRRLGGDERRDVVDASPADD